MITLDSVKSDRIQILRGLSIIAVVLGHCAPSGLPQVVIRPFLNFSVGLFLFLSGMLSSAERWNPAKRIKKVIIPYLFWTLVYILLNHKAGLRELPIAYLKSLLYADSSYHMYFILVYCELTLIIPLLDKLAKSKFKYIVLLISPIEIILFRTLPFILNYQFPISIQRIIDISFVAWFDFFYFGYLLGNEHIKITQKRNTLIAFWIVSVVLQMGEGYLQYSLGNMNCGTQMKLSALLTSIIACILAYLFINSKEHFRFPILAKIGEYSFGIYFAHIALLTEFNKVSIYKNACVFPMNALAIITANVLLIWLIRKLLGGKSRFIAF